MNSKIWAGKPDQ